MVFRSSGASRRTLTSDIGGADEPLAREYGFSLTAGGGLQLEWSAELALIHREGEPWRSTIDRAFAEGQLQPDTVSARRIATEAAVRLRTLSPAERGLLVTANSADRAAILWLAACRAYRIVGEFAVEVVSDRYQVFRTDLEPHDFDVFFEAKSISSVKLQTATKSTRAKIRSLVFRFMREARILTEGGRINGMLMTPVIFQILRSQPRDQKYFPNNWRRI